MDRTKIFFDAEISLGAALESRLSEAHLDPEYIPLSAAYPSWEQIDILCVHSFLPDECLRHMKKCLYIGIRGANTTYVNGPLAASMGIRVEGLKIQHGVNAVAEHTIALLFCLAKNLVNADRNAKGGKWREGLGLNFEVRGKTLGIIGYGKIGKRVAEIARSIGMEVLVSDIGLLKEEVPLDELLERSDVISLHLAANEQNRNFLNEERIGRIKNGAMLINTTRGFVADYGALEKALRSGRLSGLGLDVFPEEPLRHHPVCDYQNVICTPHIAFTTKQTLDGINEELVENVLRFISQPGEGQSR